MRFRTYLHYTYCSAVPRALSSVAPRLKMSSAAHYSHSLHFVQGAASTKARVSTCTSNTHTLYPLKAIEDNTAWGIDLQMPSWDLAWKNITTIIFLLIGLFKFFFLKKRQTVKIKTTEKIIRNKGALTQPLHLIVSYKFQLGFLFSTLLEKLYWAKKLIKPQGRNCMDYYDIIHEALPTHLGGWKLVSRDCCEFLLAEKSLVHTNQW